MHTYTYIYIYIYIHIHTYIHIYIALITFKKDILSNDTFSDKYDVNCVYYNSKINQWTEGGMYVYSVNYTALSIICATKHFSRFAILLAKKDDDDGYVTIYIYIYVYMYKNIYIC